MSQVFSSVRNAGLAVLVALAFTAPAQALDLDSIERRAGSALSKVLDVARDHVDSDRDYDRVEGFKGSRSGSLKNYRFKSGKGLGSVRKKVKGVNLRKVGGKKLKLKKLKGKSGKLTSFSGKALKSKSKKVKKSKLSLKSLDGYKRIK